MIPPETVKLIQDTAVKAADPQRILSDDPRVAHYRHDNKFFQIDISPPLRRYAATRLAGLAAIADDQAALRESRAEAGTPRSIPEIFIAVAVGGSMHVALLLDPDDRREWTTYRLRRSWALDVLVELGPTPNWLDHRQFLDRLRELEVPEEIVVKFRTLDFAGGEENKSTLARDRESLGKSITARVVEAAERPDRIDLDVRPWLNADLPERYPVSLRVDMEASTRRLSLYLAPGTVEELLHQSATTIEAHLRGALANEDISIFHADPV